MNFYEFFVLLEGLAEDLVRKNPGLRGAYDQGVRNPVLLKWVSKVSEKEPVEDVIPVVMSFEKNKQRLVQKDINFYKSAGQLRQAIEDLGKSGKEQEVHLKENETTRIGQFGEWLVVMPHTRESSCQWGKGTTWCTAATQSGNLFLNYTGRRKQSIILYYLIRRGADTRQDPESKISIGFVDGEPILKGQYGGVTVDAQNNGVGESSLRRILGVQYDAIMKALKNHNKSLGGKHPAKNQMEMIAKSGDPKVLEGYMSGMKPEDKKDFLNQLMMYELSESTLRYLLDSQKIHVNDALSNSALSGNLEMVKRLCHDSPPNEWISRHEPERFGSALAAAAENNHLDVVKFISEKYADDMKSNRAGNEVDFAFEAAAKNGSLEVLKYFLQSGLKEDLAFNNGMTEAAENGHLEVIRLLADPRKFGFDMDGVGDHEFEEGLEIAVRRGNVEAVKLFIDLGANNLNEALSWAASAGKLDVLKFLLDNDKVKKQPSLMDHLHGALSSASSMDAMETVDHLFKLISKTEGTKYINLALDRAARNGKMNAVKYLVENGVEISKSCLSEAAEMDRLEVLEYLIEMKIKSGVSEDLMMKDVEYALNLARNRSRSYLYGLINKPPPVQRRIALEHRRRSSRAGWIDKSKGEQK
jgi:ankyrin repeat protein